MAGHSHARNKGIFGDFILFWIDFGYVKMPAYNIG
jgi:hypothetical protein